MANKATTMESLTVEGCALRCVVEGEGDRPALVLLHMLGTDLTLWDGIVPELLRHFRVLRLDARGHGGSELGGAAVTVERLGRDIVGVLDALKIDRAHVCGLSMGGAVGLWLLAHAPARIERAVIAGSAAKLGTPAMWNGRIAAALAGGIEPDATIERWFSPGFAARAPEKVDAVRALLRETPPKGYAACCGALRDMDLREAVRAIAHPVLIVRGRDDPSVSPEDVAHLAGAIEGSESVEFDARHCPLVEVEAEFAAAVVKFLTAEAAPRRAAATRAKGGESKASARGKTAPQAKSAARRAGGRGLVAARQPVALTAPVSGKAVAKASAARKAATRTTPRPDPSRRGATAKSTRAAAPRAPEKAAAPKSARKALSDQAVAGSSSGRTKAAPANAAPAYAAPAKAAGRPAGKAASSSAPKPGRSVLSAKPTTAAAARQASSRKLAKPASRMPAEMLAVAPAKTKAAPVEGKAAPAKAKAAPIKAKAAPTKAKAAAAAKAMAAPAKPRGGAAGRGKR